MIISLIFSNSQSHYRAINVIRHLLTSHDSDLRFQDVDVKSRVASLYLPLVGIVMDALPQLYDPVAEARPRNSAQQVRSCSYRVLPSLTTILHVQCN